MKHIATLFDPCPTCGHEGHIHFIREHVTRVAGIPVPQTLAEYFTCDVCGLEFTTPDCADPLEALNNEVIAGLDQGEGGE